jgi:hypothetical protein
MSKQLFDEKKPAKEAAVAVKEEEVNGDFERLMDKDVSLNPEIQKIITSENGRCDKLSGEQKEEYANWICGVMDVKAVLRPIDFIPTQNGLKPYLNKGAAEIIRDARGISVTEIKVTESNGLFVVYCNLKDGNGRTDADIGAWPKGNEPHNAMMKAVTKAKRRATLSMCRLGGLVEEAHPTEYTPEQQSECKSQILLEDEKSTKKTFRDVCLSKIERDDLPPAILASLLEQAGRLAGTKSIDDAARWLQEKGEISITTDDKDVVTKAIIKEVKNASK